MKKHKKLKTVLICAGCVLILVILAAAAALVALRIRTDSINDDFSGVFTDPKYSEPVSVDGIETVTQDVSCGYAVIEMFGAWCGKDVTDESLYGEYGRVVTSTGGAFRDEMNRQFPGFSTEMHKYLKNTELIDTVYSSLRNGVPVPFEWAAKYGDEWTLHYSLITGMDIPGDRVTVANPYGYTEKITLQELLDRTSFRAYSGMPLFLKLGFAFGIFEKNTVFTATPDRDITDTDEKNGTDVMPADFSLFFSCCIIPDRKNILDTENGIIQKDLVLDGTASSAWVPDEETLRELYCIVRENGLASITRTMTSSSLTTDGTAIGVDPNTYYEISFVMNGERHTVIGDATAECYIQQDEEARRFMDAVREIRQIMKKLPEWSSLPEANGAYQ